MSDVVIFDGVCNLCAHSVQFILKHEAQPDLHFAAMQSPASARLLREFAFDPYEVRTFVLIENGKPYTQSDAALRIARRLRVPWRLLAITRVVPKRVRDFCDHVIASNRYRWFGMQEICMVPKPQIAARFLRE